MGFLQRPSKWMILRRCSRDCATLVSNSHKSRWMQAPVRIAVLDDTCGNLIQLVEMAEGVKAPISTALPHMSATSAPLLKARSRSRISGSIRFAIRRRRLPRETQQKARREAGLFVVQY